MMYKGLLLFLLHSMKRLFLYVFDNIFNFAIVQF